jgi:hypothetical protein
VARLGSDLAALVATLDSPLVAATAVTGLPARARGRATFRLRLADGRVLKGRRLDAVADAERIQRVVTALGRPELPRILARRGAALLEEWLDGASLGRATPAPGFVGRCGALLGAIHATPADPARWGAGSVEPARHRAGLLWTLDGLVRDGVLPAATAAELQALADAHLPPAVAVGFVHRDFCGENLVRGPDGEPRVVDSGNVGIDAYDLDLARTWYRWPLTAAGRRAFDAGYARHRALAGYQAHFPFWAVSVLADATLFRVRARAPGWRAPLRRLERLLRHAARGHAGVR